MLFIAEEMRNISSAIKKKRSFLFTILCMHSANGMNDSLHVALANQDG